MESTRLCHYTVETSSVASVLWKNSLIFTALGEDYNQSFLHQRRTTLQAVPSVPCLSPELSLPPPKGDFSLASPQHLRKYRREDLSSWGQNKEVCTSAAGIFATSMNGSLIETQRCHFVIHDKLSQASSA